MEVIKKREDSKLFVQLIGRLDTNTSGQLEEAVRDELKTVDFLQLDFKDLEYISSAGLRVLLSLQKVMNTQGEMIVTNVNDDIKETLTITGFVDILTLK